VLILTVIQGPDKGKSFQLPANEPQLVGRSSEALPLRDGTVSRRHAELTPDEGEWWIRDLGSQNGTYVNGIRIGERTRLRLGDQLRTGSTLFVFGKSDVGDQSELVRIVKPREMDTSFERTLASNEDSIILAEPEPRSAAMHHLQVIYRLTALTSQLTDREELLKGVMELIFSEFRPERGCVLISDAKESLPRPVVVKHARPQADKQEARIHVSKTILQHALRKGEGVLSSNAMTDPRFASGDSVQQFTIRSAICSPIKFKDRTFGAVYVDSSIANYTFTPEQLALLNAIGRHTGLALANAEAYASKLQGERLAAIGQTVASLSHSIKNILQGLRGGADVVEMGLKKDDLKVARGGWGILKRNLDRIMSLSMNMLAYSRQRTVEVELVKIGPLLEECAELLHDLCEARQVALIIDADADVPPIPLDPHLMHQALMNLMTNALEAVEPKRGAVTVRASYHPGNPRRVGTAGGGGPELRIMVLDNGPGILPEKREQIFEPFFTTKGLRGTGLGLAVTKRIVEEHGGRLDLASEPGKGATFTVHLPADRSGMIDPSATAASRQQGGDTGEAA
jgi:two-component system, NtrC family, sensor kinase